MVKSMSQIRDISLAPSGAHKIEWVRRNCPLLRSLEEEFAKEKPFDGKVREDQYQTDGNE